MTFLLKEVYSEKDCLDKIVTIIIIILQAVILALESIEDATDEA